MSEKKESVRKFILLNYFFSLVSNFALLPFFPAVSLTKNVREGTVGLILSCFDLGGFAANLILAKILYKFGRKFAVIAGLVLMFLSTSSFGLIEYIDNYWIYILISILIRILQGIVTKKYLFKGIFNDRHVLIIDFNLPFLGFD